MVAPINRKSDVVTREYDSLGFVTQYNFKERWVQARPFNIVLPYSASFGTAHLGYSKLPFLGGCPAADVIGSMHYSSSRTDELRTQSFDRMKSRAYDTASTGLNLIEYEQSVDMIARTAGTLLRAARQVKKGNFVSAAKILKQHVVPKNAKKHKSFANNWLEYHFGWSPLMGDIHDSIEIMRNPLQPAQKSKGKASYSDSRTVRFEDDQSSSVVLENWTTSVQQGVTVLGVQDAAAFSLEQLGLNNPALLAWEAVPYSFVVDWFANVGNILESYTAFSGLELGNQFTTTKHFVFGSYSYLSKTSSWSSGYHSASGGFFKRESGIGTGGFQIKSFKPPSKERAATAISLLLKQFR